MFKQQTCEACNGKFNYGRPYAGHAYFWACLTCRDKQCLELHKNYDQAFELFRKSSPWNSKYCIASPELFENILHNFNEEPTYPNLATMTFGRIKGDHNTNLRLILFTKDQLLELLKIIDTKIPEETKNGDLWKSLYLLETCNYGKDLDDIRYGKVFINSNKMEFLDDMRHVYAHRFTALENSGVTIPICDCTLCFGEICCSKTLYFSCKNCSSMFHFECLADWFVKCSKSGTAARCGVCSGVIDDSTVQIFGDEFYVKENAPYSGHPFTTMVQIREHKTRVDELIKRMHAL
jgi:hypothetical protein